MSSTHATTYQQLQRWLEQGEPVDSLPVPVIEHLAACATCRGALLLMAKALGSQIEHIQISCDMCQEQLAAYLDTERALGRAQAWQLYPAVGWHLLTCEHCAETHHLLHAVLDAELSGVLEPPASLLPARHAPGRLRTTIRLPVSFLQQVLPSRLEFLGAPRGTQPGGDVIYEAAHDGYTIRLTIDERADDSWSMTVIIDPPINGQLTLTLGELIYTSRFRNGIAVVGTLPTSALDDLTDTDLVLAIEDDHSAASGG